MARATLQEPLAAVNAKRILKRRPCRACATVFQPWGTSAVYCSAGCSLSAKVDKIAGHGPQGDCWLYTGTVMNNGYGELRFNGQKLYAHRVAYEAAFGSISAGMCVCHSCDVKLCVNPAHYFLGTDAENHDDCVSKKRHAFGARNGQAKLTDEAVAQIRASDMSGKELARTYGVSVATISEVRNSKMWRHV